MTSTLPLHRHVSVAKELERASDGRLTAAATVTKGIQVICTRPLSKGDLLMECRAIRIALDPSRWTTNCGFCAATNVTVHCSSCHVVGFCGECWPLEKTTHGQECAALRSFVEMIQMTPSDGLLLPLDITSHLLTIRLLACIPADIMTSSSPNPDANTTTNWWTLLPYLYASTIPPEEQEKSKIILAACQKTFTALIASDTTNNDQDIATDTTTFLQTQYATLLARILGCSHAITDLSLPLGTQTLGRALFWHHSFYNHACSPNAFLSYSSSSQTARVHLLQNVAAGDSITLSYIPLSGLSRQERQDQLSCHYEFTCDCETCRVVPCKMDLPEGADVDSIRQIQYSCNERLVAERARVPSDPDPEEEIEDEIENVLSLVRMTQRGMARQGIPVTHEVSLEAHRLLAMGSSLLRNYEDAITHHQAWFQHVVVELMDPIAIGTQRMALARDLAVLSTSTTQKEKQEDGWNEWQRALQELATVIGLNHPWLESLREEESSWHPRATKKPRIQELPVDANKT